MTHTDQRRIIAYYPTGTIPAGDTIWVFGTELHASHARGDARIAVNHFGARLDVAAGPSGSAYAIPTRGTRRQALPLADIRGHVQTFAAFARQHPNTSFTISRLGNGIAGLQEHHIAHLFLDAPINCSFHQAWQRYLHPDAGSGPPTRTPTEIGTPESNALPSDRLETQHSEQNHAPQDHRAALCDH